MSTPETRRVELFLPVRTLLLVAAAIGVMAAFMAIGDMFLIVFVGVFLALVFEYPVRFVMAKTRLSRGLAATVTLLGTAVAVTVFFLLLLVPLVGVGSIELGVWQGIFFCEFDGPRDRQVYVSVLQ